VAGKAARNGFTDLFGKLEKSPIPGLLLPKEVTERAQRLASEEGLPFQEYLREKFVVSVMGRDEVERRFRARLDAIAGKPKE
jgi:hypothetical protein